MRVRSKELPENEGKFPLLNDNLMPICHPSCFAGGLAGNRRPTLVGFLDLVVAGVNRQYVLH